MLTPAGGRVRWEGVPLPAPRWMRLGCFCESRASGREGQGAQAVDKAGLLRPSPPQWGWGGPGCRPGYSSRAGPHPAARRQSSPGRSPVPGGDGRPDARGGSRSPAGERRGQDGAGVIAASVGAAEARTQVALMPLASSPGAGTLCGASRRAGVGRPGCRGTPRLRGCLRRAGGVVRAMGEGRAAVRAGGRGKLAGQRDGAPRSHSHARPGPRSPGRRGRPARPAVQAGREHPRGLGTKASTGPRDRPAHRRGPHRPGLRSPFCGPPERPLRRAPVLTAPLRPAPCPRSAPAARKLSGGDAGWRLRRRRRRQRGRGREPHSSLPVPAPDPQPRSPPPPPPAPRGPPPPGPRPADGCPRRVASCRWTAGLLCAAPLLPRPPRPRVSSQFAERADPASDPLPG